MKKIMLSLACMLILLIGCRLHAMNSDNERLIVGRDSHRFGAVTSASITPEDCDKIEAVKKLSWPGGDPSYPRNRIIAAIVLREACDQKFKDNVLYNAVLHNDYYLAHDALEHGANPNHTNDNDILFAGRHILFTARSIEVVKLLVAKGASLNARLSMAGFTLWRYAHRSDSGFTLLHEAACGHYHEPAVLQYYIQNAEIPINFVIHREQTPLHVWAQFNYFMPSTRSNLLAKLKLLLHAGVDCARKDIDGKTALDILNEKARYSSFSSDQHLYRTFKTRISTKMREQQADNAISQNPQPAAPEREADTKCAICHEEMQSTDQNTELSCGHTYCTSCITQWFETRGMPECPFCKDITYI